MKKEREREMDTLGIFPNVFFALLLCLLSLDLSVSVALFLVVESLRRFSLDVCVFPFDFLLTEGSTEGLEDFSSFLHSLRFLVALNITTFIPSLSVSSKLLYFFSTF